jgi:hypothetical protein
MTHSVNIEPTLRSPSPAEGPVDFSRYAYRYEVQAAALTRGMRTALFIEKFKRGMLDRQVT